MTRDGRYAGIAGANAGRRGGVKNRLKLVTYFIYYPRFRRFLPSHNFAHDVFLFSGSLVSLINSHRCRIALSADFSALARRSPRFIKTVEWL